MPSLKHSGGYGWSQLARKKLHADLAKYGVSIDADDVPALRRAVARVLEVQLPETVDEQDDLMRQFGNGSLCPPLHEFEPLEHKPWDEKRFRRDWALTLEKLGRTLNCQSCDVASLSGWSLTFDLNCRGCCERLYRATFPLARPGVMFQIARFQSPEICDEIAAAEFGAVAA